jgi:hypothetical protein
MEPTGTVTLMMSKKGHGVTQSAPLSDEAAIDARLRIDIRVENTHNSPRHKNGHTELKNILALSS